jgi:outer membrane protein with beta-barrel domain
MKRIYILLVAVLIFGSLNAQAQLKLGLKGGVNLSKLNSSDPTVLTENVTAWHFGGMAEIKMPIIGIELDALYTQNGSKIDFNGALEDLKNTYISLPLLAKVYILKVLNVQVGPQFSWLTSTNITDIDPQAQLASNDLQIVFGAGVDLAMLHASLRYHLGVKDVNASTVSNFDLKNNAVMLSVGIWLKK